MSNEQYFFLMHKNDAVTVLNIDVDSGTIIQTAKHVVPELLPLGGRLSEKELRKWWNRRAIPSGRIGVETLLSQFKMQSVGSLLVRNLALSLTDHYWIKPYDSDLTWEQVNLYENDFFDIVGAFQFSNTKEELYPEGKPIFSPGASLQGELKKKWVIGEDKVRYLVKGNYGPSCQQSLNEILATEIHRLQQSVPYTEYKLTTLDTNAGKSLGCMCKNFTDIKTEFIPAIDINSSEKKRNECSEFEFFIQLCCKYGLQEEYVRGFLDYQILTDFIITNTDRHFNNFGVLRDSETLKFVGIAPIFDSGNSMFWNVENLSEDENVLDVNTTSFKKKEIQLLSYVTDKTAVDLTRLPGTEYLLSLYEKDINMSEYRRDALINVYKKKCGLLEQYQIGKNLKETAYAVRKMGKQR